MIPLETAFLQELGAVFGTKNGKLFGSADDGDSWKMIEGSLPEICCVKAYTI